MDPAGHLQRKGIGQTWRGNEGNLREYMFLHHFQGKTKKRNQRLPLELQKPNQRAKQRWKWAQQTHWGRKRKTMEEKDGCVAEGRGF